MTPSPATSSTRQGEQMSTSECPACNGAKGCEILTSHGEIWSMCRTCNGTGKADCAPIAGEASFNKCACGHSKRADMDVCMNCRECGLGERAPSELQLALACPRPLVMGEHACANRKQCFEPCGDLGHHEEYAVKATPA